MSTSLDMDLDMSENGLHVVAAGPFLILEMDKSQLDRGEQAAQTHIPTANWSNTSNIGRAPTTSTSPDRSSTDKD